MRTMWRTLKHYLVPHRGNKFKPRIFAAKSIAVIVLVLMLFEGAYYVQVAIVYTRTSFLASVLPGVIAALTNQTRESDGLKALAEDPVLDKAAQAKADDMAAKAYFAHVSPDGKTPWYWLEKIGYNYSYAGENLAINFMDSSDVEKAWIESPPHYANIVKAEYTKTGVGTAHGMYEGRMTVFVVQFFATPAYAETVPAREKPVAQSPIPPVSASYALSSSSQVLGAEAQKAVPTPALNVFQEITTSPKHTITYVIGGAFVFFLILLLLAIFVKIRVQYIEVIFGGIFLLAVIALLLWLNGAKAVPTEVAPDGQSASVVLALQGSFR